MGGKRTGARNLFYLCIAGLIFLSLWGCVRLREKEPVQFKKETVESKKESAPIDENLITVSKSLLWAKILLERQDYDGALKENQKVLALSGKTPPGDDALYNMGLIYAHFGNPKKDYGKSLAFFKRMTIDYPQSALAEQARIWIGMLQENEKLNQTIQKLNLVIEESKRVDIEIEEKKREKAK
ncbi:MAG: hypothetical protein A2V86_16915 [Deltaproteobacteria bacterium RBG_16_49_23]|nr:MAG: hypothetical protein A2V86_16915 [Deltaproteobacteria bacterium RBG_16_49_23]